MADPVTIRTNLKRYGHLVAVLVEIGRAQTVLLAISILMRALAPIGFLVAAGVVIGRVPGTAEEGLGSDDGRTLLLALGLMGVAFLLQQVLPASEDVLTTSLGERLNTRLERRLMTASVAPLGITHLEGEELQSQLATVRGVMGGWPRPGDAVRGLAARAGMLLTMTGAAIVLVGFHWWVAVPLLGAALWSQARSLESVRDLGRVQGGQATALRRPFYLRDLGLQPPAAKELRVFGLGPWLRSRFQSSWDDAAEVVLRRGSEHGRALWAAAFLVLVLTGALSVLADQAVAGRVGLTEVAVYFQAMVALVRAPFSPEVVTDTLVLEFTLAAVEGVEAAERAATFTEELPGRLAADGLPRSEIRFEKVAFRYPGADHDVLHDLDLVVPAGDSLAIVGPNGAGKTTLIKLLCRLYEPTAGRITVDGIELADLDPASWRRRLAAVFQDFVRFPFGAAENVAIGGDRDRVVEAASRAMADGILTALPRGYDTVLSTDYEGGRELSGGEWQRVALARALYASSAGASVLVLDEPTASLDVRAEAAVYDRFLALTAGHTTIVISHRFSTVRRAGRICVLEGGRIVEEGDHTSLVAADGEYARLFALQAERFADEAGEPGSEESP